MKRKQLKDKMEGYPVSACIIKNKHGEEGIVLQVGENLARTWLSGDIIVHWENGEHTILPKDFKFVKWIWEPNER